VQADRLTVAATLATRQGRSDSLSNWNSFARRMPAARRCSRSSLPTTAMTGPGKFRGTVLFFKVMGKAGRSAAAWRALRHPAAPSPSAFRSAGFGKTVPRRPRGRLGPFVRKLERLARGQHPCPIPATRSWHSPEKMKPQTHEHADHSIPYAAGLVLIYGKIEPEFTKTLICTTPSCSTS